MSPAAPYCCRRSTVADIWLSRVHCFPLGPPRVAEKMRIALSQLRCQKMSPMRQTLLTSSAPLASPVRLLRQVGHYMHDYLLGCLIAGLIGCKMICTTACVTARSSSCMLSRNGRPQPKAWPSQTPIPGIFPIPAQTQPDVRLWGGLTSRLCAAARTLQPFKSLGCRHSLMGQKGLQILASADKGAQTRRGPRRSSGEDYGYKPSFRFKSHYSWLSASERQTCFLHGAPLSACCGLRCWVELQRRN